MGKSTKIWLVVGLFIIAGIIAFAIYKGIGSSQETTTITQGGATSKTTNGIGSLLGSIFGVGGVAGGIADLFKKDPE